MIDKISISLLKLEIKSDNIIKSKATEIIKQTNIVPLWVNLPDGNLLYHLQKKNTVKENSSVRRTKQNRLMPLSNCAICGKKKSRFIKTGVDYWTN